MGGDLGGRLEGSSPKNLRWGRPMHPSPNISRSSVIGCVAKYKLTKRRCNGVIFCSEIQIKFITRTRLHRNAEFMKQRFFVRKKGHMCYISDSGERQER